MTVDVSLYLADRPLSWHSKTCRLSHEPVWAAPSFGKAGTCSASSPSYGHVDKLTLLEQDDACECHLFTLLFLLEIP